MSFSVEFLGISGSIQDASGSNTSIIIRRDDSSVLVDVSGNLAEAVGLDDLRAIILTHEHIDHIYALPSLLHQLWLSGRKEPLLITASQHVLDIVSSMIDLFRIREKKGIFSIDLKVLEPFEVSGMEIVPFKTDHTSESYGIKAEADGRCLVYTSDTRPIKECSILSSADVLITESSGLGCDEDLLIKKGHQSASDAAGLAVRLNAERLYLVHLPASSDKRKAISEEALKIFKASELPILLRKYEI